VATRLRDVDESGFMVGMTEQRASDQTNLAETIDYIAWEAGSGDIDKDRSSGDVYIAEEQWQDSETWHVRETIGYLAIGC